MDEPSPGEGGEDRVHIDALTRHPATEQAHQAAAALLTRWEGLPGPDDAAAELLSRHALLLAMHGVAERGRALSRRWYTEDPRPGLARAEAVFVVSSRPTLGGRAVVEDPERPGWLRLIDDVLRGRLTHAVALGQAHQWWLDDVDAADGVSYGLWALILEGEYDAAEHLLASWTARHGHQGGFALMIQRTAATVAGYRCDYLRQIELLEQALRTADEQELAVAREGIETTLVVALAGAGDFAAARAIVEEWPPAPHAPAESTVEGYRNLARMDLALLEGEYDAAFHHGERAAAYTEAAGHVVLGAHVAMGRLWAAPASEEAALLARARRVIRPLRIERFRERLAVTETLREQSGLAVRELRVPARGPRAEVSLSLPRLFSPPLELVSADVYLDRVRGLAWVRSRGPVRLGDPPVVHRALDALVDAGEPLDFEALYQRVWGTPWEPLAHEGKLHVTLHRLRRWLDGVREGSGALVRVKDGLVSLEGEDTWATASGAVRPVDPLDERVLQLLAHHDALASSAIADHLRVSRSSAVRALRRLVDEGRVDRLGQGPATRYLLGGR